MRKAELKTDTVAYDSRSQRIGSGSVNECAPSPCAEERISVDPDSFDGVRIINEKLRFENQQIRESVSRLNDKVFAMRERIDTLVEVIRILGKGE